MVPAAASSPVSPAPPVSIRFTQLIYLQWILKTMLEETALWATRNIRSLRRLHGYVERKHPGSTGPAHEVTVKAFGLADRAMRQYSSYARQTIVLSDSVTRFRTWKDTSLEIARDLAERHTEQFLPIMNDLLSDDELDFCLFSEEDYGPSAPEACSEYDLWNMSMSAAFVSHRNWLLPSDGDEVEEGDFDPMNGDEALAILSTLDELIRLCEMQGEINVKSKKTQLEELEYLEKQFKDLFRRNIKTLITAGTLFASNTLPTHMLIELDTLKGEVATPTKTWLPRASILANAVKQKPRMPRSAILAILRHDPDDSDHSSDKSSVEADQDTYTSTRPQTSIPTQFALRSNTDSSLPAILEEDEPSSKQTTPTEEHLPYPHTTIDNFEPSVPISRRSLTIHPVGAPLTFAPIEPDYSRTSIEPECPHALLGPEPSRSLVEPDPSSLVPSSSHTISNPTPILTVNTTTNARKHRAPSSDSDRENTVSIPKSPRFGFFRSKGRTQVNGETKQRKHEKCGSHASASTTKTGWRGSWSKTRGKRRRMDVTGSEVNGSEGTRKVRDRGSRLRESVSRGSLTSLHLSSGERWRFVRIFCIPGAGTGTSSA